MHDIFLSYSSQDRDRVRPLYDALKQQGWTVFWDHATIQTGAKWQEIITEELNACGCVMVVWTQNSLKSDYVLDEARHAKSREVLLPLSLDDTKPPLGFGGVQTLDITDWDGKTDHPKFAAISRPLLDKMRQATQKRLTEFKQQQADLAETQKQLAQQRDELDKQARAAQQVEADFAQQRADLEKQQAEWATKMAQGESELAPKLAAAELRARDLDAQLTAAREQARLAAQHAAEAETRLAAESAANQAAQQQLAEQKRQAETLQANLSAQLSALQSQHEQALQQAQQAQQTAEAQQRAAEQARQTAEDKLRTAQQSQQTECVQLNQQIADQQRELTALRQQSPKVVEVEKVVEKIVLKPVGGTRGTVLGALGGMVLAAVVAGVMWPSKPVETPARVQNSAQQPSAQAVTPPAAPPQPSVLEQAKAQLKGNDKAQYAEAVHTLEKLDTLDADGMWLLAVSYEKTDIPNLSQNYATACHWYQQAAQAGHAKARTRLNLLKSHQLCK